MSKRFLLAFSSPLALALALAIAPAAAQQTRTQLQTTNNSQINANGLNKITGAILNSFNNSLIQSMGVLDDANAWTGTNTFAVPIAPASGGVGGLSGILYGNGSSAPTAITPGAGVVMALGQPVCLSGGFNITAANNAQLSALSSAMKCIWRTGYGSAGDSPPVFYVAESTCPWTSGADGGACVATSDSEYWVAQFPSSGADVQAWGVKCDGTTVNNGIATAEAWRATAKAKLLFPGGICLSGSVSISAGTNWEGIGGTEHGTIIEAKAGLNADFVSSGQSTTVNADDVTLQNITFDGNMANNTAGNTLTISGARPTLINIVLQNCAGDCLYMTWNPANAGRLSGANATIVNLTIDSAQKHGWECYGPSDMYGENIIITDPSLSANNGYYGWYMAGQCNGRFVNIHPSNRSTAAALPIAMVYVGTSLSNFTTSQFEGGITPLVVSGGGNTFSSSAVYAPRGPYAMAITGNGNYFSGILGGNSDSSYPNWYGINLAGGFNLINAIDGGNGTGSGSGAIIFGSGDQYNQVNITGDRTVGSTFSGTPAATDNINANVAGAGGVISNTALGTAPVSYTPTMTYLGTAPTTATATGSYTRTGNKTITLNLSLNVTTLGSGTGSFEFSLPSGMTLAQTSPCSGADNSAGTPQYAEASSALNVVFATPSPSMAAHTYYFTCAMQTN